MRSSADWNSARYLLFVQVNVQRCEHADRFGHLESHGRLLLEYSGRFGKRERASDFSVRVRIGRKRDESD